MSTMNQLYPSRFLKAEDLNGKDVTYTMQGLELEEVGSDQDQKPVLYFNESDKGLILNKTNFKTIAGIHGADSDDWASKRITLYPTEVEYGGQTTLGIRVRLLPPKPAPRVTQRPPMPPEPGFNDDQSLVEPPEDTEF